MLLIFSQNGVLDIKIPSGLLLATCRPTNETREPATLFKAEFNQLAGSGRIKLAQGERAGIVVEIEALDLSILKTKPFEPKLPLPLTFESELMKTGILQLKPIINQYLRDKPIFLPEDVTPIVAYPEVFLNQTQNGMGYAQILSYCTCSDFQAPGSFSKCDDRSELCSRGQRGNNDPGFTRRKRSGERARDDMEEESSLKTSSSTANTINTAEKIDEKEQNSDETSEKPLPKIAQFLNNSETFHKFNDKFNNFLEGFFDIDKNKTGTGEADPAETDDDDDSLGGDKRNRFLTSSQGSALDTRQIYLTQFETSTNCSLSSPGDNAKSYRLTPKSYCSPIVVGSERLATSQYYVFKPDGSRVLFGCFDKFCKTCTFDIDITNKDSCIPLENNGQSFMISYSENLVEENILSENNGSSAATFYFNEESFCDLSRAKDREKKPIAEMVTSIYELGFEDAGCIEMADGMGFLEIESDFGGKNSSKLKLKLHCSGDYSLTGTVTCTRCSSIVENIEAGECRDFVEQSLVKYSKSEIRIPEYILLEREVEEQIMITVLAIILSSTLVSLILVTAAIWWCLQTGKGGDRRIKRYWIKIRTKCADLAKCLGNKFKLFASAHIGLRFLSWKTEEKRHIFEDVVQNLFLLINGICAILFAFEWNSPNNPLLLFSTKMSSKIGFGSKVLDMSPIDRFTENLNYYTYLVNIINGIVAFLIVFIWCITKEGSRAKWTKLRLLSSTSMLSTILLTIACVIFTTYFDGLIQLKQESGYFITDNSKMRNVAENVLKVSLQGLSLTVISFTIVFLFHGVGGGLYSGTVLFRILQMSSKKENLEILTTLLVILTIIQPFICLHPVIIWSQDSAHNAQYLILTIFVWFLPLLAHLVMKLILTGITSRYQSYRPNETINSKNETELKPLRSTKVELSSKTSLLSRNKTRRNNKEKVIPANGAASQPSSLVSALDVTMQVIQLLLFLSTFSIVTHYIINMELDSEKQNLKHFVLPAIISVFMWMMSISYFLLSLVMNEDRGPGTRLEFKDNSVDRARVELQQSLRRRLALMERSSTLGTPGARHSPARPAPPPPRRPPGPPPPPPRPPLQSKSEQISATKRGTAKTTSLPPLYLRGNQQETESRPSKSGSSLRIKIRENEKSQLNRSDAEGSTNKIELEESCSDLDKSSSSVGSIDLEDVEYIENNANIFSKLLNFILERQEYSYPETHGWRIKFRRIFLHLGVLGFSYTTYDTLISTQSFSAKREIQNMLELAGTNLTWPDEGSALDDVFQLYNETQQRKGYVMIAASLLFWASLILDFTSFWSQSLKVKSLSVIGSRVVNFIGSLFVFASVILVGLPDYLEASNLDKICPYCGEDFNRTVKQVAEFSIGLFFACLFTFQLLPVLMTIAPALVRASCLILIHPGKFRPPSPPNIPSKYSHSRLETLMKEQNKYPNLFNYRNPLLINFILGLRKHDRQTALRMSILQQVIIVSSLLSFPITFVSMCIVDQHQKDVVVSILIIMFWILPPLTLYFGLQAAKKYKKTAVLLAVYYMYNMVYFGLVVALILYSFRLDQFIQKLREWLEKPSVWFGTMAQVFLCNVVISDLLYMTVF